VVAVDQIDAIRQCFRRGEYLQARRLAEAVLALDSSSPAESAAAAQIAAEAAYQLYDTQASISLARRAIHLADSIGDMDRLGRALFRLFGALIEAGESSTAMEVGERFLAGMGDNWPHLEPELAAKAYSNLGMVSRNMRRYPDALQAYWQALIRFQRAGHAEGEAVCRQQMAWLLVTTGQLDEAEEHLERSGALVSPDIPGYVALHQFTGEAMLRLEQRRYSEALALAEEVLAPGRPDVTPANRAVALYVAGMVSAATEHVSTARMFLGMAREAAIASGLASVMNLVQRLDMAVRNAGPTE
jgi:tetratricopeptide (TPR) repeat protein